MPKELISTAPKSIAWRDYEDGPLAPRGIRLKAILGCEKHGTSMAFINGHGNKRGHWDEGIRAFRPAANEGGGFPMVLGNQMVGEVVAVGSAVSKRKVGDRVMGYAPFRPTVSVDEEWGWLVEPGTRDEDLLCLDPALFALGAVRDGQVRLGDVVAVSGLGAIGLVTVALLKRAGAGRIIVTDPVAKRLELAKSIGATDAIPSGGDTGLAYKDLTGGRGPDVVIDFSGALGAFQAALRGVAYGGTVVLGAFPSPWGPGLDLGAECHMNRPRIISSRACSDPNPDHPRWDFARMHVACLQLIKEGAIPGKKLIDPIVRFEDLVTEYPRVAFDYTAGVKLGVRYDGKAS
jgi:threonine dehydrogenase-like Zn-dependent dehydrogenase